MKAQYGSVTINVGTNPNRKRENSEASEKDLAFRDKLLKKSFNNNK